MSKNSAESCGPSTARSSPSADTVTSATLALYTSDTVKRKVVVTAAADDDDDAVVRPLEDGCSSNCSRSTAVETFTATVRLQHRHHVRSGTAFRSVAHRPDRNLIRKTRAVLCESNSKTSLIFLSKNTPVAATIAIIISCHSPGGIVCVEQKHRRFPPGESLPPHLCKHLHRLNQAGRVNIQAQLQPTGLSVDELLAAGIVGEDFVERPLRPSATHTVTQYVESVSQETTRVALYESA